MREVPPVPVTGGVFAFLGGSLEDLKEIKPEELILTYLDGAPGETFDFVRVMPDGKRAKTKVRLQYQRAEHSMSALKAAQDHAKERGELEGYGDIYRESQAYELLRLALRHPEKSALPDGTQHYPPLFTDTRQVRLSFTESEIAVLLNCYQIVKSKYSALESLDEQDAEVLIAKLSDPLRGPFFLSQLDSLHWPGCILLLAGIVRDLYQAAGLQLPSLDSSSGSTQETSTAATGSSGEQPSASSTQDPTTEIGPGALLTKEQAREIVNRRQKKT